MSINAREKAIEARLLAMVGLPSEIDWPNQGVEADASGIFLEVQHFHNRPTRPGCSVTQRRPSISQVTIVAPENKASTPANEMADLIIGQFPADFSLAAGSETLKIAEDPQASGGFPNGGSWRLPVSIRWEVIS